jgi:hypothetical protein
METMENQEQQEFRAHLDGDSEEVSALADVMIELANLRPLFHSEADFQHALAWKLSEQDHSRNIRLEYRVPEMGRRYIDIWFDNGERQTAIELKYWTRQLECEIGSERFSLLNQSAQDIGRYDFLKDIQRLETVAVHRSNCSGFAIALTNDRGYWNAARSPETVDAAFRLHEGREISGSLGWSDRASDGTKKSREEPILLKNTYKIRWRDFSRIDGQKFGWFRWALVEVSR